MVLLDIDLLDKKWKKEIQEYRNILQKKGLTKEPLRVMIDIMNKYRIDSLNIILELEKKYQQTLIDGAISIRMIKKIKEYVVKENKTLTKKELEEIAKKSYDEIVKEIGDSRTKTKKSFSKYKK
ncbi:MAG: hypothetical protein EAX96_10100 [Candidatus Lokiarchaeota archaeon]|nr:hypothetical protein [Candidatus Lokiarchaeota archaeon]